MFGKLVPCPHRQSQTNQTTAQKLWHELGPLREMTLDNFEPEGHAVTIEQKHSLRMTIDGVRRFIEEPRGWLLIQGGYGCGKTHLAAAIANACLGKGIPVVFVNVPDLLDYLRGAYNPNVEETYDERFNEVRDAAILILDDLGTQNATPWAEEKAVSNLQHALRPQTPDRDHHQPRSGRSRSAPAFAPERSRSGAQTASSPRPIIGAAPSKQGQSSMSSLALYHDKTFETLKSVRISDATNRPI